MNLNISFFLCHEQYHCILPVYSCIVFLLPAQETCLTRHDIELASQGWAHSLTHLHNVLELHYIEWMLSKSMKSARVENWSRLSIKADYASVMEVWKSIATNLQSFLLLTVPSLCGYGLIFLPCHSIVWFLEDIIHKEKKSSESGVPLPSHFTTDMFTITAFDNFDHSYKNISSGKSSTHDTVITLFQEAPVQNVSKPNRNEVNLNEIKSLSKLPSQE